ncbi:hypothetical protein HHA01_18610 [Halomonas halmophila]|uniref:Uncharacterized protein n=1 Tax=Halomonas halmophila TaxID=252 RepID=A0A4Y4F4Y0_9GAMM|nr:hypothetical protein HHA01_18610 [Halomonas halmophila]
MGISTADILSRNVNDVTALVIGVGVAKLEGVAQKTAAPLGRGAARHSSLARGVQAWRHAPFRVGLLASLACLAGP